MTFSFHVDTFIIVVGWVEGTTSCLDKVWLQQSAVAFWWWIFEMVPRLEATGEIELDQLNRSKEKLITVAYLLST